MRRCIIDRTASHPRWLRAPRPPPGPRRARGGFLQAVGRMAAAPAGRRSAGSAVRSGGTPLATRSPLTAVLLPNTTLEEEPDATDDAMGNARDALDGHAGAGR